MTSKVEQYWPVARKYSALMWAMSSEVTSVVKCWNPKFWKDGGGPGGSLGGFGIRDRSHTGDIVGFSIPRANSEIVLMN
jgi:hypothetical protein